MMTLTLRQQTFLSALLDLYHEGDGAIAYAQLAERVGVRQATAYQMLRLLEQKGMVTSEYGRAPRGFAAGRAPVLFRPTPEAEELVARLGGEPAVADAEWAATKRRILTALQAGEAAEYHELLEDLLARLPSTRSPLVLAGEVLTLLLMAWRQGGGGTASRALLTRLLSRPVDPLALGTLAGAVLGMSWGRQRPSPAILTRLADQLGGLQEAIGSLSAGGLEELYRFVREVTALLDERPA